jgi:hypothetical protein
MPQKKTLYKIRYKIIVKQGNNKKKHRNGQVLLSQIAKVFFFFLKNLICKKRTS